MDHKENNASVFFFICLSVLITAVSFMPSLVNHFTNWDDNVYLLDNLAIRELSLRNIWNIFTSVKEDFYKPLVLLSYSIEYHFFKLDPMVYHITNYILHLSNTFLVFWLFYLLTGNRAVSFLVSLFFGIHPMHVESVAWIPERKDMLYSLFFLSALISYLFYLDKRSKKYYFYSFIFFIGSLMSKPVALTLPGVLLLCDYFVSKKPDLKKALPDKVPFFAMSLFFGVLGLLTQKAWGAINLTRLPKIYDNFLTLTDALVFYWAKLLVPVNLSCIYPYPQKAGTILHPYIFSPWVVFFAGGLIFHFGKNNKKVWFGSLFFLITIFPMLQFVPIGPAMAADRYTYISSLGLFYLAAVLFDWLYQNKLKKKPILMKIGLLFMALLISFYSYSTWNRCKVWKDSLTLWNDVLSQYPKVPIALMNRANVYSLEGKTDKALEEYNKAVRLSPNYDQAYLNRGNAFILKGDYDLAMADYEQALRLNPNFELAKKNLKRLQALRRSLSGTGEATSANTDAVAAYNNRGFYYLSNQQNENALTDLNSAIRMAPDYPEAYNNRGIAYAQTGDHARALENFNQAIKLKPEYAEALNNRAFEHALQGENSKAISDFSEAVRIKPAFYKALRGRGIEYTKTGEFDKAIADFKEALKANPDFVPAQESLRDVNRFQAEVMALNNEIMKDPGNAKLYYNLANWYADHGSREAAIRHYDKAIDLDGRLAEAYNNRGSLYQEKGLYDKAMVDYNKAIDLKPDLSQTYFNKGLLLEKEGNTEKAIEAYNAFIKFAPSDNPAPIKLALEKLKKLKK